MAKQMFSTEFILLNEDENEDEEDEERERRRKISSWKEKEKERTNRIDDRLSKAKRKQ